MYPVNYTSQHSLFLLQMVTLCHGSPEADGGSAGSHLGLGVWLCRGTESKEPLVFTLNPHERAWTTLQENPGSLRLMQSDMATAEVRSTVQQATDVVRQGNGQDRWSTFNMRSGQMANKKCGQRKS